MKTLATADSQTTTKPTVLRPRVLESSPVHEGGEAEAYGAMVRRHGCLLNIPFVEMVSRKAAGLECGRVLDIGSGPGHIPIALALRHPRWEIVGTDPSADMREAATFFAAEAGVMSRVQFVEGSGEALPFEDNSFDFVISNFVLHHISKPESLFNEVARVMRGGGRTLIKDLGRQPAWKTYLLMVVSKHLLHYTDEQLRMYRESINAALTKEEVCAALARSRLCMARVSTWRGLDLVLAS